MTRIGTGLSSKTRTYAVVPTDTDFHQLESPIQQGSQVVNSPAPGDVPIGTPVDLAAGPVRTLDSSYVQGLTIYNDTTTVGEFLFVAGVDYDGQTLGAASPTAFKVMPGESIAIDCRDGSGIAIAFSSTVGRSARIIGN
jgi:hypothetical protein